MSVNNPPKMTLHRVNVLCLCTIFGNLWRRFKAVTWLTPKERYCGAVFSMESDSVLVVEERGRTRATDLDIAEYVGTALALVVCKRWKGWRGCRI